MTSKSVLVRGFMGVASLLFFVTACDDSGTAGADAATTGGNEAGATTAGDGGATDAGTGDTGTLDADAAEGGDGGTGGMGDGGTGGVDASVGNACSATIDGNDVSSPGVVAVPGGSVVSVGCGVLGYPGTLSQISMNIPIGATGALDCAQYPPATPEDPYLILQPQITTQLSASMAMNGDCVINVTAATANSAAGTFSATVGNGVDSDYVITNGSFSVTF